MSRRSFKQFYRQEKEEKIFEKTFEKFYKRGHFGKIKKDLIRGQQKDWYDKLKNLIDDRDYGSLLMAVGHRKNKVSRELFSRLTGINIKQKTTKIIEKTLKDFCLRESHLDFEKLKENKKTLTDDERKLCIDKKAMWHNGPKGQATPAVWKSIDEKGNVTFVTNTHRAFNTAKTLEGAIERFHKFIKGTA